MTQVFYPGVSSRLTDANCDSGHVHTLLFAVREAVNTSRTVEDESFSLRVSSTAGIGSCFIMLYSAFGLSIESEIPFPELLPGNLPADVFVRLGNLGAAPGSYGHIECERADANEVLLSWGRVALALVRGGREIIIDPMPEAHADTVRLLVLGAAMGVLLHQRGFAVLHASSVLIDDHAVAFIGEKGTGKSSTAAALVARGWPIISDDLVAVQLQEGRAPAVVFGYSQIKLWPDTLEALGSDPSEIERIHPLGEKRRQAPRNAEPGVTYPLSRIYVLGAGEALQEKEIAPQAAFFLLLRNLYVSRFGKQFHQPGMTSSLFAQCAALVKSVPVVGLVRERNLSALPVIAELVEKRGAPSL